MLEDRNNFHKFIEELPKSWTMSIFIWEENILPFLKDYTIIFKPVSIDWKIGYIWIIWSLKMNYSFNISAVRWII
jgi:transcriptional regulator of heat shock response